MKLVPIVTCMPNTRYFVWQTEIQIINLKSLRFPLEYFTPVIGMTGGINVFNDLVLKYPEVNWRAYTDFREDKSYAPSIKPYLLSKFVDDTKIEEFFLIDSDVIFRQLPDFSLFSKENTWYLSNTAHYMDSKYIDSKGEGLLEDMCRVVGVDSKKIREIQVGGAQWYVKNTNAHFWLKVYKSTNRLVDYFRKTENYWENSWKKKGKYIPIQSWCAEMWTTLWLGSQIAEIEVHSELDFAWSTDPIEKWKEKKILHNAGVTDSRDGKMFYKGEHSLGLVPERFSIEKIDNTKCSYIYSWYVNKLLKKKP